MTRDLAKLRFVPTADVYKAGILAAHLTRTREGAVAFAYTPEYLAAGGAPVASTLPAGAEPAVHPGLPPFFAGLLPEGHRLTVLRSAVKTSPDDELSVLLAVGADVPGDVQVVPSGERPEEPPVVAELDGEPVDFSKLADTLDLHGLPGVQDKVSASMLTAPLAARGGRYILKLDPPDHPHLVLNESLHLLMAAGMRLPVATHSLRWDTAERAGLLVRRFDRAPGGDGWRRLPLEDGAQLLGVLPAMKYGVSTEDVIRTVADACNARPVALRNLYMQFLFAWLTGNGDLHAKNVAALGDGAGNTTVAPIFDIPCTLLYGDESVALPVGGATRRLKASHWAGLAQDIGLPAKAARSAALTALRVADKVDLGALPFTGTRLHRAQRELRTRRQEISDL
ncbi:type II toxin-antitoxin system HipA family toxin [Sinomonas sp. G460-2]|uniref:type II toxin-antitoxin system HipA family toxin n=1 Tax=Sinomonas sp. G460-2 TaxID=3393464 RepID=UPI0039EE6AE8